MALPTVETVNEQRVSKFLGRITTALESAELAMFRDLVERYEREKNVPAVEIAAALAKLVQGDMPLLLQATAEQLRPHREGYDKPGFDRHESGKPSFAKRMSERARGDFDGPRTGKFERDRPRPHGGEHTPAIEAIASKHAHNEAEAFFDDEAPRAPRPPREERRAPEAGMETFRIEVGHRHGVKPGNIVGAIANEAELESRYIGRIDIRDDFSLIDLPEGMPREIMDHLKRVRVAGQPLRISRPGESRGQEHHGDDEEQRGYKPRGFDKRGSGPRGPKPHGGGPRKPHGSR
jgi:ATP-dependent RNA helicase DeaD